MAYSDPHPTIPSGRWLLATTLGLCAVAMVGCKEDPSLPDPLVEEDSTPSGCVDKDDDGYGSGCDLGRDCDDRDAEVTNGCRMASCSTTPTAPGCPCDEQGAVVECGETHIETNGVMSCGFGFEVCDAGQWSGCRFTSLEPRVMLASANILVDCAGNPCDPYCAEYLTTPGLASATEEQICAPDPSCQDGLQNQAESGIDCGGPCAKSCPPWSYLIDESFTGSDNGFVYGDDRFRGTNAPDAASGTMVAAGNVVLGQGSAAEPSSGGWSASFSADAPVVVTFDWEMEAAEELDPDDCVEVLVSVDTVLYGKGSSDRVARLCGGGAKVGTFQFVTNMLTSGTHVLSIGGYLNSNTGGADVSVRIDNVTVLSQNTATCGDAICDTGETCVNCSSDCGSCNVGPYCGDATCQAGETCGDCPTDCGACVTGCGDGSCDAPEDCDACPSDCGVCLSECGDGQCAATESCDSCASDCGVCVCGDATCGPSEDCSSCAADCGACETCGDATCGPAEDCSSCESDCGACVVVVTPQASTYLEAECPASSSGSYTPGSALTASGVTYIQSAAESLSTPSADRATYSFTAPAGSYRAFIRVDTNSSASDDSWFWRVPALDTTWILQNDHAAAGFKWVAMGSIFTLPSDGTYEIEIGGRENGLKIDRIAILSTALPPPSGVGGAATNCDAVAAPSDCGNAICDAAESCTSCAIDCGACSVCGDATCDSGEDCASCASDCGTCTPLCGDDTCDAGETCDSCAKDCGICPYCGDDECGVGESCGNCATDCGVCVSSETCGNEDCEAEEDCSSCAADCGPCFTGPVCGDDVCEDTESCSSCALDCGSCDYGTCGDKVCDPGDNCGNCPGDCGVCELMCVPVPDPCGNDTCEAELGEDCLSCPGDCGVCKPSPACGNSTCEPDRGEDCDTCPGDCGACSAPRVCGDALCEVVIGEDCGSCPADCGSCQATAATVCGDMTCSLYENCDTCPADCGACPSWGTNGAFNGGIIATGDVVLMDRATINGDVMGQDIHMGSNAMVSGNVSVNGDANLQHDVNIGGTFSVEGALWTLSSPDVGAMEHPTTVELLTIPPVVANPGTTGVYVWSGDSRTLLPGAYGVLQVVSSATLYVSAGRYDFSQVMLEDLATVVLDFTDGPIEWRVGTSINLNGDVTYQFINGPAMDFGMFSGGNITVNTGANFPSSLYAPSGTIRVNPDTEVTGGLAAQMVHIEADAVVGVGDFNVGWGADQTIIPEPVFPACGDGVCTPETGESCNSCSADCGACAALPVCGDSSCDTDAGENCGSCPGDCGVCIITTTCGDDTCSPEFGENCTTCEDDCDVCAPPANLSDVYQVTDYSESFDVEGRCGLGQVTFWAFFSWQAETPDDAQVIMFFSTAETEAELDTAEEVRIVVAARNKRSGGWRYGPPPEKGAMTVGAQFIDSVLEKEGIPRHLPYARLRYELVPTSDGSQPASLVATNLQSSCRTIE